MKENVDFPRYVVSVAIQKIQQIADKGECDGAEGHKRHKLFGYVSQIAR